MISVTNDDIIYAEKILLKETQHFDDERITFIKNLNTIDLQAVPGSGKTTALLAKLLILERYMPLENGRGILVISHTNAAVDEIKERIGKFCPKLFSYPNFIGTIQSFVDQFLAIPFGQNDLKSRFYRIESERFEEELWYRFQKIYWKVEFDKPGTFFYGRSITNAKKKAWKTNKDEKYLCNELIEKEVKNIYYDFEDEKIKFFRNNSILLASKENKKYKGLKQIIIETINSGVISYEYAYKLGMSYLNRYPKVSKILRGRFKYIFVDEMQDMDEHQIEILEAIFYDDIDKLSIMQRIGDENQAIFSGGEIHLKTIWKPRGEILYIKGSHRLSAKNAAIIQNLALTANPIEGRNKNANGSEIDIKPIIFTYDDSTITQVIPHFAKKIAELKVKNLIPKESPQKHMAVAWRKDHEDENNIALADYWPNFSKSSPKTHLDFIVLEDYILQSDKEKKTLETIRKNILNALLKILRLENIYDEYSRIYTKRKLINHFKTLPNNEYETLKLNLYQWSIDSVRGKNANVIESIKAYVPIFLTVFEKSINNSGSFVNDGSSIIDLEVIDETGLSFYESEGVSVEIGTVHSAKGQTHTATLYLESYYYNDGGKSYESQRLKNQLLGIQIPDNAKKRVKQSSKMAYVGFSRPTHLLCLAIHKKRFDSVLSEIDKELWDVIEVKA